MTLWGRRRCHATAFKRDSQPLDFELEFESGNSGNNDDPAKPREVPAGIVSLKLVNRLKFDLNDCWLVVGITHVSTPQLLSQRAVQRNSMRHYRAGLPAQATPPDENLIDLYHTQRLADLRVGETREEKFQANFQVAQQNGLMVLPWPAGSRLPPRISRLGTASAWIVGRCRHSPIMEIDERKSDFIPQEQNHFFVQEILPEEMPDALQFTEGGK